MESYIRSTAVDSASNPSTSDEHDDYLDTLQRSKMLDGDVSEMAIESSKRIFKKMRSFSTIGGFIRTPLCSPDKGFDEIPDIFNSQNDRPKLPAFEELLMQARDDGTDDDDADEETSRPCAGEQVGPSDADTEAGSPFVVERLLRLETPAMPLEEGAATVVDVEAERVADLIRWLRYANSRTIVKYDDSSEEGSPCDDRNALSAPDAHGQGVRSQHEEAVDPQMVGDCDHINEYYVQVPEVARGTIRLYERLLHDAAVRLDVDLAEVVRFVAHTLNVCPAPVHVAASLIQLAHHLDYQSVDMVQMMIDNILAYGFRLASEADGPSTADESPFAQGDGHSEGEHAIAHAASESDPLNSIVSTNEGTATLWDTLISAVKKAQKEDQDSAGENPVAEGDGQVEGEHAIAHAASVRDHLNFIMSTSEIPAAAWDKLPSAVEEALKEYQDRAGENPIAQSNVQFGGEHAMMRAVSEHDSVEPIASTSENAVTVEDELTDEPSEERIQPTQDEITEGEAREAQRSPSEAATEMNDAASVAHPDGPPAKKRKGKKAEVATAAPRRPHIIPSFSWLLDLAKRLVDRYNMPRPCLLCVYRTLYHLFEVGPHAARLLRGEAIAVCDHDHDRVPEEERIDQQLPAERADSVPEDLRELAEAVGAAVLGENGPLPFIKRTGPDASLSLEELCARYRQQRKEAPSGATTVAQDGSSQPSVGPLPDHTNRKDLLSGCQLRSWVQKTHFAKTYCHAPWCPLCWTFFETREECRAHWNRIHGKESYQLETGGYMCPWEASGCQCTFLESTGWRKHIIECHMASSVGCDCGEIIAGNSSIVRHKALSRHPQCRLQERPIPGWHAISPVEVMKNLGSWEATLKHEFFHPPETKADPGEKIDPAASDVPVAGPSKRRRSDDEDQDDVPKELAGSRRSKRART